MGLLLLVLYRHNLVSQRNLSHGTVVEFVWTLAPALVLVAIGLPSFRVLYLADEILSPSLTVKAIGHQWYWSYAYDDLEDPIAYDSYMIAPDSLETSQLRLLDVDTTCVLPIGTIVRFLALSTDVIHSFAVPSLGMKLDCMPGRLNQTTMMISRAGTYYGQCSELCGAYHAFMPIRVDGVSPDDYVAWLQNQVDA